MKRALLFPYTFVLMNWAVVVSLCEFLQNRTDCNRLWSKHASGIL